RRRLLVTTPVTAHDVLRCGRGETNRDSLLQHPAGDPAHVHVDGGGCHEAPVADGHVERVQARVKAPRSMQTHPLSTCGFKWPSEHHAAGTQETPLVTA